MIELYIYVEELERPVGQTNIEEAWTAIEGVEVQQGLCVWDVYTWGKETELDKLNKSVW